MKFGQETTGILLEFLQLGDVDDILFPFDETDHKAELIFSFHKTVSPDDPKYDQYIAEHREWIVPIKEENDRIEEK